MACSFHNSSKLNCLLGFRCFKSYEIICFIFHRNWFSAIELLQRDWLLCVSLCFALTKWWCVHSSSWSWILIISTLNWIPTSCTSMTATLQMIHFSSVFMGLTVFCLEASSQRSRLCSSDLQAMVHLLTRDLQQTTRHYITVRFNCLLHYFQCQKGQTSISG